MNWQDLGGSLIKAGAPIIGRALGGPLGGMLGDAVGGVLAQTLGTEPTPEAVDEAISTTPASELQSKLAAADSAAFAMWPALAEMHKADTEAAARALVAIQDTIRAEAVAADPLQRWWRPIYAFELVLECATVWALAMYDLLTGGGRIASFVTGASGLLATYWMARFGVLGVYVTGRSFEKVAGRSSGDGTILAPALVDRIIKAVRKR